MALTTITKSVRVRARGITLTLMTLVLLTFASSASANTNVTSCSSITGFGDNVYTLTANVTGGCVITGLTYAAGSGQVFVDCGGHSITGTQTVTGIPGVGSTTAVLAVYGNANAVWMNNCNIGDGTQANSNGEVWWDCGTGISGSLNLGLLSNSHLSLGLASGVGHSAVLQNCNGMAVQGSITAGVYSSVITSSTIIVGPTAVNTGIRNNKFDNSFVDLVHFIWPNNTLSLGSHGAVVSGNLMLGSPYVDDALRLFAGDASSPNLIHDNDIRDFGDTAIEGVGNTSNPVVGQSIYSNSIRTPYLKNADPPISDGSIAVGRAIGCFNPGDSSSAGCTLDHWYIDSNTIYAQAGGKVQGFWFYGGNTGTMTNVTITNNTVTGTSYYTNYIGTVGTSNRFWTASNVHVGGNHFGGDIDANTPYGIYDDGGNYCTSSTVTSLTCH